MGQDGMHAQEPHAQEHAEATGKTWSFSDWETSFMKLHGGQQPDLSAEAVRWPTCLGQMKSGWRVRDRFGEESMVAAWPVSLQLRCNLVWKMKADRMTGNVWSLAQNIPIPQPCRDLLQALRWKHDGLEDPGSDPTLSFPRPVTLTMSFDSSLPQFMPLQNGVICTICLTLSTTG